MRKMISMIRYNLAKSTRYLIYLIATIINSNNYFCIGVDDYDKSNEERVI